MIMSRCCCRAVRLKESWPNYFNQKDSDRKVQSGIRQTSESFRENCRKHGLIRNRIPPRTSQPGQKKRDLTVSGFVFALVLIGVILAANTEQRSLNDHGQDTGLGLRNMGIIWEESAA